MLEKDESLGVCAPDWIVSYFDKTPETDFWNYERFIFQNPEARELFFKDWPADQARAPDFESWANAVQPYTDVNSWRDIMFEGQCLAGDMWDMDMDMPDFDDMQEMFEDLDIDVDVRDDGMTISMEGMTVEMEEGENGNSMRIVLGAS